MKSHRVKACDWRARVLVVDDEPDFCELMEDMLSDQFPELRVAADPDEALAVLGGEVIDVMLVDLQMPKGGGRRLLAESKRHHPDVYSVVVTAYGSESIAVEMLKELGAYDYLSKADIDEDSLTGAIRAAILARHADRLRLPHGFDVLVEARDGVSVLYAVGGLNARPTLGRLPALAEALDDVCGQGARRLLIDLTHLESAAAVALGFLWEAVARLERAGGMAVLFGANRDVARSLMPLQRTTPAGRGLLVYPDRRAALAALTAEQPAGESARA